jgi:hypothetical protein
MSEMKATNPKDCQMAITETKYGLGDTAYVVTEYAKDMYGVVCGVIDSIRVSTFGRPCYQFKGSYEWHLEEDLYQTRAEAESNRTRSMLAAYRWTLVRNNEDLIRHQDIVQRLIDHQKVLEEKIRELEKDEQG